ncbi:MULTISPECIES: M10 family metallopeptidase C-terminal domain-containing protein [unclassified Pseudomonas]|uniref:M10 family metallopeptidase C-terminal domain-containing protein n=1 Tax=unclassified Pseudomonas TaxID=196821 RepID=UPI0015A25A1C|nr:MULTISPECIES: M10 family metallopeptidase C-terminal domain-containing protein [unclassified Pseudomonas]NWC92492.1 M10 family metallopeptidase C-terminal domain-containing protein [Pseudomonas sp. IPO3779]NWD15866.1 M10 family metallopeptidase C-terminal domain-containing protein [Pseudomonas sp. IPO3778]
MLVESLPVGGTWTYPEPSSTARPTLRGTDASERLEANRGQDSVIIGGGGGDQLVGHVGRNSFKYEKPTDSLASDPDRIFNFNPKDDRLDLSKMLKKLNITQIKRTEGPPQQVGDMQLTYLRPQEVGVLTIKVTPEGEHFAVHVDGVHLTEKNIKLFNKPT